MTFQYIFLRRTWPAAPSDAYEADGPAGAEARWSPSALTVRASGATPPASRAAAADSRKGDASAASSPPGGTRALHCITSWIGVRVSVRALMYIQLHDPEG